MKHHTICLTKIGVCRSTLLEGWRSISPVLKIDRLGKCLQLTFRFYVAGYPEIPICLCTHMVFPCHNHPRRYQKCFGCDPKEVVRRKPQVSTQCLGHNSFETQHFKLVSAASLHTILLYVPFRSGSTIRWSLSVPGQMLFEVWSANAAKHRCT